MSTATRKQKTASPKKVVSPPADEFPSRSILGSRRNGHGPGMIAELRPYVASGGQSELWSYADGEGLTIESQEGGSYVIAWSAHVPAAEFLRSVGGLVDASVEVELTPPADGVESVSLATALELINEQPARFDFLAVDTPQQSYTWAAVDPAADAGEYPDASGEVGIMFSVLEQALVAKLIRTTATSHVKEDLSNILLGAQRLVGDTSQASV
jgi:hypothetical protein